MTATVTFQELLQDAQELGSDDEHMVSRITFNYQLPGKPTWTLVSDIKQPVGSTFEGVELEVSRPRDYKGPFNFEAFRAAAEAYYRSLVGATGNGIRISGAANVRMRNNRFVKTKQVQFEVEAAGGSW